MTDFQRRVFECLPDTIPNVVSKLGYNPRAAGAVKQALFELHMQGKVKIPDDPFVDIWTR